ncbi:MAG: hypothetical protein COW54_15940 [Rhodobacteraceae bacterium CG17_big_fil_post_rev_8_21_14_2_50_63_15]|nr:hypothetical protein [Roseovarius sp.]PIV77249.1 MAG: hypothetical protein COW54_15940 [Rhodobacteraceae bacterium CG17_big_fil_post_rev_8_21_14_2_50_63_15]
MSKTHRPETGSKAGQSREDRLKSALKANLARRKAQTRARETPEARPKTTSDGQTDTNEG